MGAGRKPTSNKEKRIKGTYKDSRATNVLEPVDFLKEIPEPPENLGKHGLEQWNSTLEYHVSMGTIATVDVKTLFVFCSFFDIYFAAKRQIDDPVTWSHNYARDGQPHPLTIFNQMAEKIKTYAPMFGITPSNRIKLTKGGDVDEKEQNFNDILKPTMKKVV